MDLLAALQAADYAKAQPLIEKVLRYEPSNELMLEYRVVVQRALKRADDHAEDAPTTTARQWRPIRPHRPRAVWPTALPKTPTLRSRRHDDIAELRTWPRSACGHAHLLRANVGYIRRAVREAETAPPYCLASAWAP